ncbi:MAG: UvrD-helicase domain-containing protein [Elusimicrobiota bacterium]|jgi:DNA helicase-2/ATP-dependent DNA helicase PcrA|nr:UvrD-helicase domain-containing protein [Elusimicrobiota bacterium]
MENSSIEKLNPAQEAAVAFTDGPLIIFAGAGTGKTRVITHRISNLLSLGVSPHSILAVTFTNKAAAEMKKRVLELSPRLASGVWISTFHSFCAYFLRVEALKIGLNQDFLIYDFADQKNVVRDCLKELSVDEKKFKPNSMVDRISRAKDDLKFPADLALNFGTNFEITVVKIYELYQKKLKRADALDFGDLIMKTVCALKDSSSLLAFYQERFKYIMVDEYQDTNHAQYELIKLLAEKHKNICVVGDDDQSVYSWRGADVNNILHFEKDYPNAASIKLEQNYRSTPKILEAAYNVVRNNSSRVEKKLWTQNPDVGSVKLVKNMNEGDEAARVVSLISNIASETNDDFSKFAVFYRTNAQSRSFEDAFRRTGLAYSVVGTLRFYDRQEVKDVMSYLKLIHNPNDNVSFKRVVNVPHRGIGKTSVETLENFALQKDLSIWQAIPFAQESGITNRAVLAFQNFKRFIDDIAVQKEKISVKSIAQQVITLSGYLKELETENSVESKTKIENVQELISAIDDFEKRSADKTLSGYLTQIALVNDTDSLDVSKGKVTLMTLHLAKGLEFDNVFLCGLEEGLFPIGEAAYNEQELEEERRLMYVGMTRARKHLFLCWAVERTVYGKTKWNLPSRFIYEAGFKDDFEKEKQMQSQNNSFGNNFNRSFNKTRWSSPYLKQSKSNFGVFQNDDSKVKTAFIGSSDSYDYMAADVEITKDSYLSNASKKGGNSPYRIGVYVLHPIFGKGKIIEKNGSGSDIKIVVLFEGGQWKKLLVRAANLKLV